MQNHGLDDSYTRGRVNPKSHISFLCSHIPRISSKIEGVKVRGLINPRHIMHPTRFYDLCANTTRDYLHACTQLIFCGEPRRNGLHGWTDLCKARQGSVR